MLDISHFTSTNMELPSRLSFPGGYISRERGKKGEDTVRMARHEDQSQALGIVGTMSWTGQLVNKHPLFNENAQAVNLDATLK